MAAVTESTREIYGKTLLELVRQDPSIVVVGGDLNNSVATAPIMKEFPERFFDVGPAEQNMMGIAAGLASSGKTVFASTFAVFGTARPYDQIRISIAQPSLNVKIVVTHAGIVTGEDGSSAQSIEDLSLMCSLPTFNVIVPADGPETAAAVRAAAQEKGPFYIRLARPATDVVHLGGYDFHVGQAETMCSGDDVAIIATGIMVSAAMKASKVLEAEGIRCRVINMATLKPLDTEALAKAARETGAIVTAEEHYYHGGLSSLVALSLAQQFPVPMEIVALDRYAESGTPQELLVKYGLDMEDVAEAVRKVINRKSG